MQTTKWQHLGLVLAVAIATIGCATLKGATHAGNRCDPAKTSMGSFPDFKAGSQGIVNFDDLICEGYGDVRYDPARVNAASQLEG